MDIEITINGKKIITQSGLTILEAASQAGIKIPVLCYLKRIKPIGSCRVCVVEVKDVKNPLPSCVAKVKEGYEIYTETEKLWEIRKEIISQLLLDHPLDCPVCDKSGDCLLQDLTFEFGVTIQKDKKIYPDKTKIFKSDLIEYNATRCVLCSRCIRVCGDMYGNPFFQMKDKGNNGYIGLKTDTKTLLGSQPAEGCSFEEISVEPDRLDCYYCGNCVEVCPVGALVSKPSKFKERYWQEKPFSSICDKCSAACRIEYYRYGHDESLVRTAAPFGGYLCKSGFFYSAINGDCESYYIANPYIKKKSAVEEVTLEKAAEEFSLRIKGIQANNAGEATAVLISPSISINGGKASLEFIKNTLKLKHFDIAASELYRKNLLDFKKLFPTEENFDINDIKNSEVMLYFGSIEDEIPFAAYDILKTRREHGGRLFIINPKTGKAERVRSFSRFEDIACSKKDIDGSFFETYLNKMRMSLNKKQTDLDDECKSIIEVIADAGCISFIIGDSLMSSIDMDKDFLILQEIVKFLREQEKSVYLFPLVKPSNYRGLLTAGVYPSGNAYSFKEIITGLDTGRIKNLVYIGDLQNDDYGKEIIRYSSNLEFLTVFSSKTSLLSAMADVVIPVKDFLEEENTYYENFEGKIINVNNEFNFGIYRYNLTDIFTDISLKMNITYNLKETEDFLNSVKSGNVIYYNKIKGRSKFYYNDKTKLYY
jgi:ferredoxin